MTFVESLAVQKDHSSKEKASGEIQSERGWVPGKKPSRKASRLPGSEYQGWENAPLARRPFRHPPPRGAGATPDRVSEDPASIAVSTSRALWLTQVTAQWLNKGGGHQVPLRAAALGSCAVCSSCWPGRGAAGSLSGRGRGGASGRAAGVGAQRWHSPLRLRSAHNAGRRRARVDPGRPQVSGPGHGRAAGTRATRRPRRAPGPRAILERAGNRRAVATSALRWGVPARPTRHFQFQVLGNFPGFSGRVSRNQAREENPHQDESFAFSAYSRERMFLSPHPALGDPICKAPRFSKESAVAGFPQADCGGAEGSETGASGHLRSFSGDSFVPVLKPIGLGTGLRTYTQCQSKCLWLKPDTLLPGDVFESGLSASSLKSWHL